MTAFELDEFHGEQSKMVDFRKAALTDLFVANGDFKSPALFSTSLAIAAVKYDVETYT